MKNKKVTGFLCRGGLGLLDNSQLIIKLIEDESHDRPGMRVILESKRMTHRYYGINNKEEALVKLKNYYNSVTQIYVSEYNDVIIK